MASEEFALPGAVWAPAVVLVVGAGRMRRRLAEETRECLVAHHHEVEDGLVWPEGLDFQRLSGVTGWRSGRLERALGPVAPQPQSPQRVKTRKQSKLQACAAARGENHGLGPVRRGAGVGSTDDVRVVDPRRTRAAGDTTEVGFELGQLAVQVDGSRTESWIEPGVPHVAASHADLKRSAASRRRVEGPDHSLHAGRGGRRACVRTPHVGGVGHVDRTGQLVASCGDLDAPTFDARPLQSRRSWTGLGLQGASERGSE